MDDWRRHTLSFDRDGAVMKAFLAIALILAAAVWLLGAFLVWATIITILAIFAIVVSCLALLALEG